eukprot:6031795-Pyramimonas_sp.AAC.1
MWRRGRRRWTDNFEGLQGSGVEGLTSGCGKRARGGCEHGGGSARGVKVQSHAPRPQGGGMTV